ncbi:G-type lectin S-receptor-like serine/threonine-protein kinase At4g27290 [Daucus carota subsp. sativus]|uniref:G-type lectin S-receptor-like serine/threonine-protein kinase At4g27290 n=1 Tax=Daucus carota subsp. sativus TaxID=79200 RepID=UPI00308286AF
MLCNVLHCKKMLYECFYIMKQKSPLITGDETAVVLICFILIFILITTCDALNAISSNRIIQDGFSTIESAGGIFELGFFSPLRSKKRYLGIWYKKISIRTIIWVANRDAPLRDTSGIMRFDENGVLVLVDSTNSIKWSTNLLKSVASPVAELLDNGNFVVRNENDTRLKNIVWQSFDHPADNLLSGMRVGWDLQKGLYRYLSSWKSSEDPSLGTYKISLNLDGYPQVLLWKGSVLQFRFGPWDGIQFSGVSFDVPDTHFAVNFLIDPNKISFNLEIQNASTDTRVMLTPDGDIQVLRWINQTREWKIYLTAPRDDCDHYSVCGGYGNCNITRSLSGHAVCGCLKGYKPRYVEKWRVGEWSNGCIRKTQLACGSGDGFVKYSGLKLPDTQNSWFNHSLSHEECKSFCLKNCSCTAYAGLDVRKGGIGCMLWFSELLDIRDYSANGLDLYVKVAASELGKAT